MIIREATAADSGVVTAIELAAFETDEEARLVSDLEQDASAQPALSLLAFIDEQPAGHILFTGVRLEPETDIKCAILAPLAVKPEYQNKGIGGELIKQGIQRLAQQGTAVVFVLGYPDYYSRHGFSPAAEKGFVAPFPIAEKNIDAWMLYEIVAGTVGSYEGTVTCADSLNKEEYWIE